MPSYSVREILSWVPLTKAVEVVKGGIPSVLPQEFFTLEEKVSGHTARMIEYKGTRKTSRITNYGSVARSMERVELGSRDIVLLSTREQIPFRDELVFILRNWEQYTPQQHFAMREIAFQGEQMRLRMENLEIAATLSSLVYGKIYFDSDGNLLPDNVGASLVVDQGVPSTNFLTASTLGGLWSNTNTNIVDQITTVKKKAIQASGYPLKYAIYGQDAAKHMAVNESLRYFWARHQDHNDSYLDSGLIPKKFLGLTWVPAYEAFYEDATGVVRELFPTDRVVFTPEITEATWAFYRGSELVPTTLGMFGGAEQALNSFVEVFGRGRYARVYDNPVQIVDIAFDHFLPRIKVPNAYFVLDIDS
jgi:hypothetical protein